MARNEPPLNHALQRTAPWRHGTCSSLASLGQVPRRAIARSLSLGPSGAHPRNSLNDA